ncbi:MAG: aspartate-semialdehyde dehydrogenase [bacterium]|nr:aspartate-semialdehyde dehydrogenase [bacterium]MCS7309544.1 aspartate-semialdehyde dehydrogenase [Armatimonadota bacterium]MDW8104226.1 aspartate-semialdehyde dehydrogenase [Armatimonadota bacterium]
MSSGYHVAIVGATGAVGTEFLRVLERRRFPVASLRLLASERSEGKQLTFMGDSLTVQRLTEDSFEGVQIAFFSAGASRSRQFAPAAVRAGAVVIDNSSAFRMDPQVPLVVPEINLDDAREHRGIIANPNCSTIIMLMAVAPLHRLSPVRRIVVSTYQAASGAGAQAMQELLDQTAAVLEGKEVTPRVLPHQIAFNLFSHNSAINEWGYNEEEWKMIHESRKILHEPDLAITATCVRVPVLRAHSESINVEFAQRRPTVQEAREALSAFPGVKLVDDRERNHFPMPIEATDREEVLVGRIREDVSNPLALDLFVSGDQLLKGAALNAVQIAEGMIRRGWL